MARSTMVRARYHLCVSRILVPATLLAATWTLSGQPVPRPSFEVASIKPSPPECHGSNAGPTQGRIELPCVNVRMLIRVAYGTLEGEQLASRRMEVIGGPSWLDSDRYTISAKTEGVSTAAQMLGPMLQSLLEERFALKVHVEARESPVFALTAAKNGSKLKPAKEGTCTPFDLNDPKTWNADGTTVRCGMPKITAKSGLVVMEVNSITIGEFVGRIPLGLDRPVIDKTGLTGRYDIHLEFAMERPGGPIQVNGVDQPAPPAPDHAGPSIMTALQEQLGLKLTPDKAPVSVILVDSVARPSEN